MITVRNISVTFVQYSAESTLEYNMKQFYDRLVRTTYILFDAEYCYLIVKHCSIESVRD